MNALQGYWSARWHGAYPAGRLLWWDMVCVGTLLNLGVSVVALISVALGAPLGLGVVIHFLPLPYNMFLCLSLWRHPDAGAGKHGLALAWLALVTLI